MEMCYDGALVMPSNYAVMCEDEMTYVEGGVKAQRYMTAGDAEYELKLNANFYTAIAGGAAVGGAVTSITGIGLVAILAVGGAAGAIASATYSGWQQARNIKKRYGSSRRVKITEELTLNPLGYTCVCKKA